VLTTRVVDWYVMTDELLYERLALSVWQEGSPLPYVHGELVANVNQLYPLLLAPVFHDSLIPGALQAAHLLNAVVMSSAAVPAFLLARRLVGIRVSFLVAVLSVCIPWIVLSSFLMTEALAYPVFLWAVLALEAATVAPSMKRDLLLLLAVAIALLARTQFLILVAVIPPVLLIHELRFTRGRAALRALIDKHRVLAAVYAGLALLVLGLLAADRLTSVLGTYSVTAEGDLAPDGMASGLLEHLAPIALGLGIVPFVLGNAWLLVTLVRPLGREQHAYATVTVVTLVALLLEVTSYDLRFGQDRLHDRYFFYIVPLVLIAFAAFLGEQRWSWWPLFSATALTALAFAFLPVVGYSKFNVDSPVAALNDALLSLGGSEQGAQMLLAFTTIAAMALLLLMRRLGTLRFATLLITCSVAAIPAQTGLAFSTLLTVDGTSGRPITLDQGVVFDWIDRKLGVDETVTMIPYPILYGNYWENVAYWWNVEFWNASVQRAALYEGAFTGTPPETFSTIPLSFDSSNGAANVSPTDYVVQGISETRFRLSGETLGEDRGVALIRVDRPWRAEWLAFDLYRDGWTVPHVTGTIRVFAQPGQTASMMRYVTLSVRGPQDLAARAFTVTSNSAMWNASANEQGTSSQVAVCVPPDGFADLRIESPEFSPIYGDPRSEASFVSYARSGGVLVRGIALADETGPC
jgi:hypothetical protein